MQISMFHKAHPKDLTQKPFDINHKSARDFGTAIGVILGFFGLFVLVFFLVMFWFFAWYQLCHLEYWQRID